MVRYYWDKKDSTTITIKEIPIKALSINGKCLIPYITSIWGNSFSFTPLRSSAPEAGRRTIAAPGRDGGSPYG